MSCAIDTTNDIVSSIEAMRRQEASYLALDYLQSQQDEPRHLSFSSNAPLNASEPVDDECRFRMVEWCFQVIDFCKFNRDTVAIAMSYLDRFLSTPEGSAARKERKVFQLAAMTCIYTAVKIHEAEAMEPRVISGLSRGAYSEQEVEQMERTILAALKWRMNPPTALSFVQSFHELLKCGLNDKLDTSILMELAKYQTELAVEEYACVGVNASVIALASIANALQAMNSELKYDILQTLSEIAKVDMASAMFVRCRYELWISISKLRDEQSHLVPQSPTVSKTMGSSSAIHESPRGVMSPSR
jgi:hypothetical protein